MSSLRPDHPLRQLFGGLVEHAFQVDIGICEPALTEYIGDLLAEFIHIDQIYAARDINHEVIRDLSRLEAEARLGPDVGPAERKRILNKYIGDFTLFWTGVYPESLQPRRQHGADRLTEYLLHGKRSYGIASELTRDADEPSAELLAQLSDQFEYCVHGLHLVRAGWEQLRVGPGTN
jgi:hypothetical protein